MKPKTNLSNWLLFCANTVFSPLLALSAAFSAVSAAPADFDAGFGQNGKVFLNYVSRSDGQAVLIQKGGKIVVAGTAFNPAPNMRNDVAVARFNGDGSPDASFGAGGLTVTPIPGSDVVRTAVMQSDGKILVGGRMGSKFALLRYNGDGSLDADFGSGGKVLTAFGTLSAEIHTLLVQPDGKVIAVGDNNGIDILLSRYNPDGALDDAFGASGRVVMRYISQGNGSYCAALQPDGKILVGGYVNDKKSATDFALFRFLADGAPDDSFDQDGVALKAVGPSHDRIRKVLPRPDGKILVVGTTVDAERNLIDYAFGVYDAGGTPDPSFGSGGFLTAPAVGWTLISDALLQPDGKIVVGGTKSSASDSLSRFHAARFNADGSFDPTFGNGGIANPSIGRDSVGNSIAIQADGKILIAGSGTNLNGGAAQFAVGRLAGGDGPVPTRATITGRVINRFTGRGAAGVRVILTGPPGNGAPIYARTNPFGFYRFGDLPVNSEYVLTISLKRPPWYQNALLVRLSGDESADELIFYPFDLNLPAAQ